MTTILFGAGASYGSGEVSPHPPPLGIQLYSELRKLYPEWTNVPAEVERKFNQDFESGMAELIEKHGFEIAPFMQKMSIYFSTFSLSDNSNNLYLDLLKELGKNERKLSNTILSTLNYECLLEQSAAINGIEQAYFDVRSGAANIWKIHGSCNFRYSGMGVGRGYRMQGYNLLGGFSIIKDLEEVRKYYNGDTSLYPAMCLFARQKPIHVSKDVIEKHIKNWQQLVLRSSKLIVIGVKPLEDDGHIWDFIASTDAELIMVGSENEFISFCNRRRKRKKNRFLGSRWADAKALVHSVL